MLTNQHPRDELERRKVSWTLRHEESVLLYDRNHAITTLHYLNDALMRSPIGRLIPCTRRLAVQAIQPKDSVERGCRRIV